MKHCAEQFVLPVFEPAFLARRPVVLPVTLKQNDKTAYEAWLAGASVRGHGQLDPFIWLPTYWFARFLAR